MEKKQTIFSQLKQLLRHISSKRRAQLSVLFFLIIISAFAEVISIGAVLPFLGVLTAPEKIMEFKAAEPFINFFKISEPKQLLLPITLSFSAAILFAGIMRLILLWFQTRISFAIGADISLSMYRRTLYQPYGVHIARNSSELIAGITNKANNLVNFAVLPILTIFSSVFIILTIMVMLITIDPTIALTAFFGFSCMYAFIILLTKKRLFKNSQEISYESNQVVKALQEGLGGIRDILINGNQSYYCNMYGSSDKKLRHAQANVNIISASPRYIIETLGMMLIVTLSYYLAARPEGIENAIPILGALALGAQRMLPVLQQAYQGWSSILGCQATLTDVLKLLKQPLPAKISDQNFKALPFEEQIQLQNISFHYTPDQPAVLQNISVTFKKGSRIGFIGPTGCGKSTLMDLIMGLFTPNEGKLLVDGISVTEKNSRQWQAKIAHVPQVIFLSDASVAENIAFGIPVDQIDFDKVKYVAKQAQIADAIETWEEKYETQVGERGVRLSGGQRQRIGIARALYNDASFIVLDEATSALDTETEVSVMEALNGLSRDLTILIVAHRLSTLKNCDKIIELENGKIKQVGNYDQIIKSAPNIFSKAANKTDVN